MPYSLTIHRLQEVTWPYKPTKKSEDNLVMCLEGGDSQKHLANSDSDYTDSNYKSPISG